MCMLPAMREKHLTLFFRFCVATFMKQFRGHSTPQINRNNKGYLDENEQKLREMDTSNRGFLTNDKVYALLEEQVKLQKTLVTQRKLLVGLCAFAVILALANMGTAVSAR